MLVLIQQLSRSRLHIKSNTNSKEFYACPCNQGNACDRKMLTNFYCMRYIITCPHQMRMRHVTKWICSVKLSNSVLLVLSATERRGTPVLLSASVSDNFGNSPQTAAPRRSREIDQSTQRFYVGWFHVGWQGIGDQSDAVTQNGWFRCALCAAISGEISILIQTWAESWGKFPVPRIYRWESMLLHDLGYTGCVTGPTR